MPVHLQLDFLDLGAWLKFGSSLSSRFFLPKFGMESWNQLIQVGTFSMDEGALLSLITGGRINDIFKCSGMGKSNSMK